MRTAFRAMVYHAENPMEQPEPTIAAGKIVDLLTAELAGTELIIKLV